MKYATVNELIEMVRAQEVLNKKYNGEQWRKAFHIGMAKMALLDEVSEMARELQGTWAWWKPDSSVDYNKAQFEFIDVIHFALLILLYRNDVEIVVQTLAAEDEFGYYDADMGGPVGDPHGCFVTAISRFLNAIDQDNLRLAIVNLKNIIETGSVITCIGKTSGVYQIYMLKNQRNHGRVDGGILEGRYDKSAEGDLTL